MKHFKKKKNNIGCTKRVIASKVDNLIYRGRAETVLVCLWD